MPCPWTRRCRAATAATAPSSLLPSPTSAPDVEDWKKIRRHNLRMMRKQVRSVILLMALMEAMRVGPIQMVYAGRHGYPAPAADDFGIGYTVGYLISWLYVCAFMIIWVPLFDWWVPKTPYDPAEQSMATKFVEILKKINMILLPATIAVSLVAHVYYTIHTLIYVDSRAWGSAKFPKNTRKNWMARAFMLMGIGSSLFFGAGAFRILANLDLAHVKCIEYMVIVVPVQVNLGVLLGTVVQFHMEKRIARKQALELQHVKIEDGPAEEKTALLDV